MVYQVLLHPKANKFLEEVDDHIEKRVRKKMEILSSKPEKGKKLKHSDFWRLRVGDHRAIYEIDHDGEKVVILFIGHRKDVYDDFSRLL